MVIAELRDTTKRFGAITALDNFNLTIQRGQILALLGRNGAGKTTAVRCLLGLVTPDSGAARVFGRDPREQRARTHMGVMLQVGRVPESLRVREHINLFSSYYPKPMALSEVIGAAGLQGIENRQFGALSGGQQQRVLFGLAICGNPDLLILDEPTAGLDVDSRRALWQHVRAYATRGGSVLLTTHYLEEADALADRVVLIHNGRTHADGSAQEIKSRTGQRSLRCVTALPPAAVAALQEVDQVEPYGAGLQILTKNPDRVLAQLFPLDPALHGIEINTPGLEQAFLEMTA